MKKIFTLFAALAMVMSMSAVNMTGGEELYLTPNSNWLQHGDGKAPRFAIYVYGSGGDAWASMTAVEGESNLYKAVVPNGNWTNVIFCRMNGGTTSNGWGNKYNQTGDLTYNGTQNWYTVKEGTWDNGGGTWALYAPEAPKSYKDITITIVANATPKIHYWDGGDKMVGTVWENLPEMTATSEANTYSCTIKDVDEAIGVKYLIKVGEVQSADQQAFNDVKVNFKDLLPQVVVQGVNNWDGTDKMTVADDYLSASITLPLIAKKYDLKLTIDGAWKGHKNENNITRAKNTSVFKNDDGNGSITADIAGDYVFTYTYANQTLTVTYPALPVKYNVTVTAENGTVTGTGTYEEGKEATLTATAAEGYEFVNWTKGEEVVSTENPYTFTVTADVALVANFKAEPKPIKWELNGGSFPAVKVPTNEELAMTFKQAYAEYFAIEGLIDTDMNREVGNFIYVTNNKGGDAIKFITENADWKWLHDYILTVAGNIPEGTNVGYYWRANLDGFFHCKNAVAVGGVASADFTEAGKPEAWGPAYQAAHAVVLPTEAMDSDFTLPTPVKEGYTFLGWFDNAEGKGTALTVITAGWSGTLYAIFELSVVNHTITVSANPAEAGTVTGGGNYEHGKEATLTATPAEGYEFVNWTKGEEVVSTENPYKFTVTADVALVANFKEAEPEYEVMDITMTNLVVQEMEDFVVLTASDDSNTGLNVMLAVNEDGSLAADSYMAMVQGWNEVELPIVEGKITKAYNEELATDVYSGLVVVEFMEGMLGLNLTMYATPAVDVVVDDATITVEKLDDGMGGTYESITVSANWKESVLVMEGIEKEFEGFIQITETFVVDGEEDFYIWMCMNGVITTVDNVLTVKGEFKNNWTGDVYNVTISGQLPVENPEPVDIVGVVKRALQLGESTVVLTHEADGTAHIYNVVDGDAYEVSQTGVVARDPENAGDLLAISDIAATEDGKLIASNKIVCQTEGYVDEGYKRGEFRAYIWNDLHGAPSILLTSKMPSNWYRSVQGHTIAYKGTSTNGTLFTTGVTATGVKFRYSVYNIIDGVYTDPAVNDSEHYHFTKGSAYATDVVGANYEIVASPLADVNWIFDADKINPLEIVDPLTYNTEVTEAGKIAENLGQKYNGNTVVTVGEQHLMVSPYATAEGQLAGVKVLDITNGLTAATVLKVADLDAPVAATAAATAVAVADNVLTVTLVADAALHVLEVELEKGPSTALENIAVEGKAVKAIINGQLVIIKNGVQYNAQGQVIK